MGDCWGDIGVVREGEVLVACVESLCNLNFVTLVVAQLDSYHALALLVAIVCLGGDDETVVASLTRSLRYGDPIGIDRNAPIESCCE